MKRLLILIVMVCAASSGARGQQCRGCKPDTPEQRAQRDRVQESRAPSDQDRWPPPKLPPLEQGKRYYANTQLKFAVSNDVGKKVKQITWECILIHPETKNQIVKYTIVTHKQIAPYKSAVLKERVAVPLIQFYGPRVISVGQAGKNKYDLPDVVQAIQENKVLEIKYADGSVVHPQ